MVAVNVKWLSGRHDHPATGILAGRLRDELLQGDLQLLLRATRSEVSGDSS
jgi:hypothetical protein